MCWVVCALFLMQFLVLVAPSLAQSLDAAQQQEVDALTKQIEANPRNYIAQPTLDFSRAPCLIGNHLEPRHVDLRPYVLFGDKVNIVPGGLTRVARCV